MIAVNISPGLYSDVERTLASGNYSDLQQLIVVALRNQLALEGSAGPGRGPESVVVAPAPTIHALASKLSAVTTLDVTSLPEPDRATDKASLLWGQVNRVLPIAVGVRVLAHQLQQSPDGVAVADWHEAATEAAVSLRSRLQQLDEIAGRRHGSLWGTAFPEDTSASAHRYVNQFLGLPPKTNGRSEGGAAFLGFVAFEHDKAVVTLTTAGAGWATFANPIFDDGDAPTTTFSFEETQFFVDHLKGYRPAEFTFLQRVASLVAEGHSRTQLDEALSIEYPQLKKYIETMRAGALGRMFDLGLLGRTRRGLTVDYALTPLAADVGLVPHTEASAA